MTKILPSNQMRNVNTTPKIIPLERKENLISLSYFFWIFSFGISWSNVDFIETKQWSFFNQ